ncbi:MAG: hypothetical protein AB7E60_07760 [Sphingobium sp.]
MAKAVDRDAARDGEGNGSCARAAGTGQPAGMLVLHRGRASDGTARPQKKVARRNSWTPTRRKAFMETLAATCNVSEAARVAGKTVSSAYYQRRRDPAFARDWNQALSVGYAELEALLLRQSLFGSEQEDVVLDGEGAVKSRKIRRGHPHVVAVRLLLAHRETAERLRAEEMRAHPDSADAVDRLRAALDAVRQRRDGFVPGELGSGESGPADRGTEEDGKEEETGERGDAG